MKLYKYLPVNKNTIESFINEYVWYSNPASFNDPFDCALISSDILKDIIHDTKIIHCLSADYKNLLMWSHYADSHRGICIEYTSYTEREIDELLKEEPENVTSDMLCIINNAIEVKYSSQDEINEYLSLFPQSDRDMYLYISGMTKEDGTKAIGKVIDGLVIKHESWSYEKEFRIIATKNKNNKVYPPGKITRIYFGANMNPLDKRTIAILFDEKCELISMGFDKNRYGLIEKRFEAEVDLKGW
ncbi:TPA: DUF2971 domain-containing protein [Vibrio parahaemolyticus]|nr:DUF2971 domain-containing protein [Vibrio parahaemolyticus]